MLKKYGIGSVKNKGGVFKDYSVYKKIDQIFT